MDQLPLSGDFFSDVPPGWVGLVARLHHRILEIAPDYELEQVKEKYGTLRYYVALPSDDRALHEAVEALIDEAEEESARTCEMCGRAGDLINPNHPDWTAADVYERTRCRAHLRTTWSQWRHGDPR